MTTLLLGLLLTGAPPEPLLRDGDRVVFLGDSITVLHTWTRLVEVAVRLRAPTWRVQFINAGVGGNTVADALARLDVDVLAHRPDVVFVNFGMNDASYPPGTLDADFEKNMVTLLDRLAREKVRHVVWLDTTPFDGSTGGLTALNRRRVARITELLEFTRKTAAERGVTLVPVNDAVTRALSAWRAAKRPENLMPDRIHPGPTLHAVMAAEVLAALGFDVSPGRVRVDVAGGVAKVEGADAGTTLDQGGFSVDITAARPLPFVLPLADAKLLDSKSLVGLASLVLSVRGLEPKGRYLVRAGTLEVGRFTGAQLGLGVELMQTAPARLAPGPERADLSICDSAVGNPWANDVSCAFNLLFGKDQLRITMRHEKTRGLPDSVPGYLERLSALQQEWLDAVERDLERRLLALTARPHLISVEPERSVDGGAGPP